MTRWLISANHLYYDYSSAFEEMGIIDWREMIKSYEIE